MKNVSVADLRRAEWVMGTGQFASVSRCGGTTTVMRFETEAEASKAKTFIDELGCGHFCNGQHEVRKVPA